MQIEVVYSNSMKINRGNYEQEAPFYSAKTILTLPEQSTQEQIENAYNVNYEQMRGIVEPLLKADYDAKRTDLLNIRIREKDGKKYPSVTSIMNPDGLYKGIKNLDKYIERGNQTDEIFKIAMTTGKIIDPVLEKFAPLTWDWDIKKFITDHSLFKKSEMKLWVANVEVFNEEYMYSGECDLVFNGSLILDVKTGQWDWEQQIAYAKCGTYTEVTIADLKKNQYLGNNVNDPSMVKAWERFLIKRGEFHARFGI